MPNGESMKARRKMKLISAQHRTGELSISTLLDAVEPLILSDYTGEVERSSVAIPVPESESTMPKEASSSSLPPRGLSVTKEWTETQAQGEMTFMLHSFVWLQVKVAPVWWLYTVSCPLALSHLLAQ